MIDWELRSTDGSFFKFHEMKFYQAQPIVPQNVYVWNWF